MSMNTSLQRMNFTVRILRELAEIASYYTFVEHTCAELQMSADKYTHPERIEPLLSVARDVRTAGFEMPADDAIRAALTVDWTRPPCAQIDIAGVTAMLLAGLSGAMARIEMDSPENPILAVLSLRVVFGLGLCDAKQIYDALRMEEPMTLAAAREACVELNAEYDKKSKRGEKPFRVAVL